MKKLFALIVSLLTLGIADALYAQEEVWHTYKLADLSDYGYTTWSIPKGNENKFLLVVDSFALTGHRIVYKMYNQDHYSVLFTKIDQKYKDKIITRVSACKEDSLPREYSFVPHIDAHRNFYNNGWSNSGMHGTQNPQRWLRSPG